MRCVTVLAVLAVVLAALPYLLRKEYRVHTTGVVVITGASSGIGLDAALRLDKEGLTVFAGVRSEKDKARLAVSHPTLHPVIVDVTKADTIEACAQTIEAFLTTHNAPLVGIVNNAGIAFSLPLELMPIEQAQWVFDVNVMGVLRFSRRFIPLLRQHQGRIVNIGSVAGLSVTPTMGVYSGTKFAVEAITDALRLELAPFGVSVSIIEPAFVKTLIGEKGLGEQNPAKALSQADYRLYAHIFDTAEAKRIKNFEMADATEVTDTAIAHALISRYPDTRYVVANVNGIPAKILTTLTWLAPDRLQDVLKLNVF